MKPAIIIVCALSIIVGIMAAASSWASLPVVYTSWSTGQCERVEDPAGKHSCEALPKRYSNVWVR